VKPARWPPHSVRRMHSRPIGPTGAATAKPISIPFRKIMRRPERARGLMPRAAASSPGRMTIFLPKAGCEADRRLLPRCHWRYANAMPLLTLTELKAALPRGSRLFGLDVGEKTIGIAVSDPGLGVATPADTIRRGKFAADAEKLRRMIEERRVGGLVVGLPVNMDGSEGPRCQS